MGLLRLTLVIAFVFSRLTQGSVEKNSLLKNVTCRTPVEAWLNKVGSQGKWRRTVDPSPGSTSYRTQTQTFGVWVEMHLSKAHEIDMTLVSPTKTEEVSWNDHCVEKNGVTQKHKTPENSFTDADLAELLKKNRKGMIYIWSPGMVYSMDFYSVFKAAAAKLKLPLTVLMDPYFDEDQAKKIAREFNFPYPSRRVESVELIMRDIGTHYPETLIYSHGELAPERIVGVMTSETLAVEIKSKLKDLK